MEYKVVLCFYFLIVLAATTRVELSSEWKQDLGWVINCSWTLHPNDSLLSVRLCENEHQFMIYRPQQDGTKRTELFRRPEDMMLVECIEGTPYGQVGTCLLKMELYQPQTRDVAFNCEVSGERPRFIVDKKDIVVTALVPPSDAAIELQSTNMESGRVTINCTSIGLPAPLLTWSIGDQKVPADFNGSFWNATSKLWHAWSTLSYTHSSEHQAVCTPEITKDNETTRGVAAAFNSADTVKGIKCIVFTITIFLLLR